MSSTLAFTSEIVHPCPKCNALASIGATDCVKCGHVFSPGIDSPRIVPGWAIEPICYTAAAAWLLLACRSAATTGFLYLPSKGQSWVIQQSSLEPWQWWALLATVAVAGVMAAGRAALVISKRVLNR
jgi:hypothetical protein